MDNDTMYVTFKEQND